MKLRSNVIYTFYLPFSINPRPNVTAPAVSVEGGSIKMYFSNTKDESGYNLKADPANPFTEGNYKLDPIWGYISFTPNADKWVDGSYSTDDLVYYSGSVYKSLEDLNESLPTDETKWELVETPEVNITNGYYEVAQ